MTSARTARAPDAGKSMKAKILAALLLAVAIALTAAHLRMPHGTRSWHMDTPAAAARSGETMTIPMPNGDVDVNRAGLEELQKLAGVGPVLAGEIIAERERNGAYHYPEDLLNVKGVGEKTLEKMLEQLKLP